MKAQILLLSLLAVNHAYAFIVEKSEKSDINVKHHQHQEQSEANNPKIGEEVIVNIPGQGRVKGRVGVTVPTEFKPMYSFYGIPYGRDTSGVNRFLPSEHPEPWEGTLDAQYANRDDSCPHNGLLLGYKGSEDCLKLYVFTPQAPNSTDKLLPVMVWFHGGGFTTGDFNIYRGNRLLDVADIVLVTVHYRLGVLGFMCAHTESAPGNAGLSDQVLALEWVQKYIHNFGGNRSEVVIAGESAGAASVSHLMLYDGASELFRGVISQSGSALEAWAYDYTPVESALEYGTYHNCNFTVNEREEFVECMREVSAEDLVTKWGQYASAEMYEGNLGYSGTTPCLQQYGARKIITDEPINKLREGRFHNATLFIGANLHEGSFVLATIYNGYIRPHNVENNPEFWKNDALYLILGVSNVDDVTGAYETLVVEKYFNNIYPTNMTNANPPAIDMGGVLFFKNGVHQTASLVNQHGGTAYVYSFEYDGFSNFELLFGSGLPVYGGVTHSDELTYLFTMIPPIRRDDNEMSRKMVKLWTNFVIHLDPSADGNEEFGIPIVQPYSEDFREYYEIKLNISAKSDYMQSWRPCMGMDGTQNNCVIPE